MPSSREYTTVMNPSGPIAQQSASMCVPDHENPGEKMLITVVVYEYVSSKPLRLLAQIIHDRLIGSINGQSHTHSPCATRDPCCILRTRSCRQISDGITRWQDPIGCLQVFS